MRPAAPSGQQLESGPAASAQQTETTGLPDDQWTLNRYRDAERNNSEPWDELEKSIIANLADDVVVSVKGNNVEIAIIKKFNKEN